jgi:hypothetical protein
MRVHSLDLQGVYGLKPFMNVVVCPNYLTPFPYSPYMDKKSHINFITISTFTILFQISFQNLHLFYHYLYQWKSHPVCKMQLRVFRICDDNHPTDLQTATAH